MRQSSQVRQRTEDFERASLSTWATLAVDTKGRERHEDPDPLRTAFQRDRDRVLGAAAFVRLADKTQTFLPSSDPLGSGRDRDRLTHTLEVAQVGRTIARALRLNEDLVEAVALAHDVGHTPFAQAGEEALSVFTDEPLRHQEQGVRVVELLERGGAGLNLTWEVRDGMLHHPWTMPPSATPEGQVVRVAVRAVAVLSDLRAALGAGVLAEADVPEAVTGTLGRTHAARIATVVTDVVGASLDQPEVRMGARVAHACAELHSLLADRVHARPEARGRHDRAVHCLRSLTVWLLEHPMGLPPPVRRDDPLVVRVVDEVAGMTDSRAVAEFTRRFLPG